MTQTSKAREGVRRTHEKAGIEEEEKIGQGCNLFPSLFLKSISYLPLKPLTPARKIPMD